MVRGKSGRPKASKSKRPQEMRHTNIGKELKVQMMPLEDLRPYERNARIHSPDQVKQIAASISQFGFVNPVLVDGAGEIIAGHGRVEAARTLGLGEVPVYVLEHLTPDEVKTLRLADNKISSNSKWDRDLLALELTGLKSITDIAGGKLADLTGFDLREIRALTNPKKETEGHGGGKKTEAETFDLIVRAPTAEQQSELLEELKDRGFDCEVHEDQ